MRGRERIEIERREKEMIGKEKGRKQGGAGRL
jgi:hypothetical protein